MKTTHKTIFLVMVLMFNWMPLDAQAYAIRGARSCGVWIKQGQSGRFDRVATESWLLGFLSGLAALADKNVLEGTDNPSLFLWMDNFCQKEPLMDIHDGGIRLFYELVKNKGL